jgi:predicted RNA binding protein YcfA (HicA-like mRNA interferase family)
VSKIPGIRQHDAVRIFEKLGYHIARQSGHIVMTTANNGSSFPATIPSTPSPWVRLPKAQD